MEVRAPKHVGVFPFSVNKSFSGATASVFLWWKYISY